MPIGSRPRPRWSAGQHIVRREVWRDAVWMGMAAIVVADTPAEFVIFVPSGSPIGYVDGNWPTADGRHPWQGTKGAKSRWQGHGCLMLHPVGEAYAIWHFWKGPDRQFSSWYINLQDPFRRTAAAMDTLDHEVDVIVHPDGTPELKDVDRVAECVRFGRFDAVFARIVISRGREFRDRILQARTVWWDPRWAAWEPPASWAAPESLPPEWYR
jgi:hypothetical protein